MEIDELRRISAKEEFSLNFIAKDEMISKILFSLQQFNDIILKGGTAINRVYLKNKRFSGDIDFDLIFKGNAKQALSRTKEIIDALKDFIIEKPRIMNKTIRYDVYYINPLNYKDRIMVEFNIAQKVGNYSRKIVNFGFVPYASSLLNVYDLKELIMQKIECIMNRIEGKDFFDLYYLIDLSKDIKEIKMHKEEIIKRAKFEEEQIKSIANILNHYIPRNQRPNWGVFLDELNNKIKRY